MSKPPHIDDAGHYQPGDPPPTGYLQLRERQQELDAKRQEQFTQPHG